jgi:hypothetical protein
LNVWAKHRGSRQRSTGSRWADRAVRALALVVLSACFNDSRQLTGPSVPAVRSDAQGLGVEGTDAVVCVSGDSPAGNYTFTISDIVFAPGGSTVAASSPVIVSRGTCLTLVSRLIPADESDPAADPVTSITYSYTSNDVAGGANYASTACVDDPGIPASSPCGTTVVAHVNFVAGTTATFSFIQSAAQMIAGLRVTVSNLDLPRGIAKNLDDELSAALRAVGEGRTSRACKELADFIKDIPKFAKKIGNADAANLVTKTNEIQLALGC